MVAAYTRLHSRAYYTPYVNAYKGFSWILERVKKHEGKIFIEDINRKLAEYLSDERVPDIYLHLGEVIYHYLIDEFQDTSPIQWRNLLPLLSNSLSQEGSLFVVGDTKQAIYGFRDADYRIMKGVMEKNEFPSALHCVEELDKNYRSDEAIVTFAEQLFQCEVPRWEEYRIAACETGLLDYRQDVEGARRGKGYVQTCVVERNDEEPREREKLYELIGELLKRGYRYSDITIISTKNSDVVRFATWLNTKKIPCLSYSSLDIRKRKITGEIVSLLNFLDSPLDDLSFATFILGDIFAAVLKEHARAATKTTIQDFCFIHREREKGPLYKAFQAEMEELWNTYFDGLFRSSGYLPIYDLITEIYVTFDLFRLFGNKEEAVLTKILEVVKDLEIEGGGSLRGFLRFAASKDDDANWNVDVPHGIDAVNVMTIHKSKGLEFPVVILVLYGERSKGYRYVMREEDDSVSLLRVTKAIAGADEDLGRRYNDERTKERVNRLNSLYVALTRAVSELYVIGVKREKDTFPFTIFPDGMTYCAGEVIEVAARPEETSASSEILHLSMPFESGAGSDDTIRFEEKRRGELMHRILSSIEYIDEGAEERLAEVVEEISRKTGIDRTSVDELAKPAMAFLRSPPISEYHTRKPGRRVWMEQEVADSEGRLFRIDRIVVDPDRVFVIEYKSGSDRANEKSHFLQMRNYLRLVRELYTGRPVEGIIGYVDLKKMTRLTGDEEVEVSESGE